MTDLKKPISRRTAHPFAHYKKRIVVSLEPGDVLAMRLERESLDRTVRAPLADVYRTLVGWEAEHSMRRKREENGK